MYHGCIRPPLDENKQKWMHIFFFFWREPLECSAPLLQDDSRTRRERDRPSLASQGGLVGVAMACPESLPNSAHDAPESELIDRARETAQVRPMQTASRLYKTPSGRRWEPRTRPPSSPQTEPCFRAPPSLLASSPSASRCCSRRRHSRLHLVTEPWTLSISSCTSTVACTFTLC
jgi:hypothetical protein